MAERKRKNETPAWLKELEDVLECPVCCETFKDPPIYLCENMHAMCSKCKKSLMKQENEKAKCCPLCRGKLTEKRSYITEKMLDKLPKEKCRHKDCDFKRSEKTLVKEHEAECLHRPVSCGICDNLVSLSKVKQHLKNTHDAKIVRGAALEESGLRLVRKSDSFDLKKILSSNPALMKWMDPLEFDNTPVQFYINFRPFDHNSFLVWISCALTEAEAASYEYTFQVNSPPGTGKIKCFFSGSRPCLSCDVSPDQVKKLKSGLLLGAELFEKVEGKDFQNFALELTIDKCY